MKGKLINAAKIAISLGLMAFLFTRPEMSQAGQMLLSANLWYVTVAVVVYIIAILVNVYKCQLLLRAQGIEVPFGSLASHFITGLFFANFLLPMVAGDVVRGYGLARDSEQAAESAISVLVDRMVGLASFLFAGLLALALAVALMGRDDFRWLMFIVLLANLAFAALFLALISRRLRGVLERALKLGFLSRLLPVYARLSKAIDAYRDNLPALLLAFLVALAGLVLTNLVNYCSARAVEAGIPLVYIFILNPLTPFAPLLIPSVGGLGVNQGTFVLLYSRVAGVASPAAAFSLSLVMQAIIYVTSLPGAFLWWRWRKL
ncbi:MAG: hypothetical protein DRI61_06145 [Chloroflexi bacterium]|nr:MAG: hypothetical protein DRI61_06145 [Chloroflexota bacterium]